jgi:hypothetical protein
MTRTLRRWINLGRLALLAGLLTACGGGVETGGTGGIGSYVEGPIAGFGSIIVNGVRFDDSAAVIEDADGNRIDRDALRLGMRVEVDSGAIANDANGRTATATRVRFTRELLGPVTGIGALGGSIDVLGQFVRVTAATVVDGVPGGSAALAPGDIVEVSGFVEPGLLVDRYVATRIERRSAAPAAYRVRGLVRELDATARTLRIGSQFFDLAATGVPAGLSNGQTVRMTVATTQVGGRWPVNTIAVESRRVADSDEAEVEGLITALTSTTRFAVNGIAVDASGATFEDSSAGVVLGARVKVRGRTAGGELIAERVELRSDDDAFNEGIELRDVIEGLNTGAQTFRVRGVTVFYGTVPAPRFDNGTVDDLADGVRVRVRAALSADRTRVEATRIEFVEN